VSLAVEVEGLELFGRHGVLAEEAERGQRFLFDLRLELPDERARSDRLGDTIDYREVVRAVRGISDGRRFDLLEALALAVAEELLARFPVARVRVRVRKPEVELEAPVEWTAATAELGRS
jgi:dihydroneopterin aldolase